MNNYAQKVFTHPRFCGLWTYRPHGEERQFCASVMVDGAVQETAMFNDWESTVAAAYHILAEEPAV